MQQGLTSQQSRQEIANALRFQQSLLRLGAFGQENTLENTPRKPPQRATDAKTRQLAAWAAQLSVSGSPR